MRGGGLPEWVAEQMALVETVPQRLMRFGATLTPAYSPIQD